MQNIEDLYELSPMQQGMLFHTLYAPASEVYFEQLLCQLSGPLHIAVFQQAWDIVMTRHPVLRSGFYWEESEKPLQLVSRQVDLPWTVADWRHLTVAEQQHQLEVFLADDRQQGFDLAEAPLMRLTLIQLAEQTYQLIWSHHHILFDGWSMQIILREVLAIYDRQQRGEPLQMQPARPYRVYIDWLQQQDVSQAQRFWQQTLQGFETPSYLTDRAFMDSREHGIFHEHPFRLSEAVTEQLQRTARQHHLTLNNLVQGAWALLLSRYSRETDVVFGATVSGRPATLNHVDAIVGLLINTLPVRIPVHGTAELVPWLKQIQAQAIEQEPYSYFSLADIQQLSALPPSTPLFDSILVFENYPVDASDPAAPKTLEVSQLRCLERTNYPLTVVVIPERSLSGRFVYDTTRFDEPTIARLAGHFQTLLTEIATHLQQSGVTALSQISLLSDAESAQLAHLEHQPTIATIEYDCVHVLFEQQVTKTPDTVAVIDQDQSLTYRELNQRANQLAHYLRSLGVQPEVRVGICVERSLDLVIGMLAILKAGGAYVPLDPAYPVERLAFMLADAQTTILLTQSHLQATLPLDQMDLVIVNLDTDWGASCNADRAQFPTSNLPCDGTPENLAYIIYTSGSTGTPKGSEVPHRSFMGFMFGVDYLRLDAGQIWLQHSSLSWDGLTLELWTPLLHGGCCVLYPDRIPTPEGLSQIIQDHQINTLWLTTALFNLMIDTCPEGLRGIQQLLTGGETPSIDHIRRALQVLPNTQIIHGYGPSECTVFTCCYPIPAQLPETARSLPIGLPIGDRTVYLLDEDLHRVPIGVMGELYVGGPSVARGYLNRPDLNRERFIPNPWISGDVLYKTGDLACRLPDGNLEFIGRTDHQVKIRGFRIELAEIETALRQFPGIQQAIVMVRTDQPGEPRLTAYLVAIDRTLKTGPLRHFLKATLPDYMIPSAFVWLDALPLTSTGKVNRRALPVPGIASRDADIEFVAPRTHTEQDLATIWSDILHLNPIGIHDNFFELGGHSLLATQVISRLRETFAIACPVRALFDNPTIAELAQNVLTQQIEQAESDDLAEILREIEQLSEGEAMEQLVS